MKKQKQRPVFGGRCSANGVSSGSYAEHRIPATAHCAQGFTSLDAQPSPVRGKRSAERSFRPLTGFTLIETFVAISVLLVSLVGPLTIAAQALRDAYYARDEITAFYLAQEGLEYVQAVRDQNYLASGPWLSGLSACVNALCQVDFPNFTNAACSSGACTPLLVDPVSGLFNAKSGTPSGFTRAVTVVPVAGAAGEVVVKATVSWVSAGLTRSFTLSEDLFNWLGT